ncbi:hypothetical protein C5S53_04075, partial [Methanophagales archaeon]
MKVFLSNGHGDKAFGWAIQEESDFAIICRGREAITSERVNS